MTCLDHLIIAVDMFCILSWVVYPAHSCPKIYAWHSMAHELRCTVGSNLFASRDGLDGLLRYQACVDHFSNRKPFHINVRLHNCLMLTFFSQESLPGYSWGGCGKSYAFTRFTTTAILPGNLETWKPTNWSHVAPSNPHQKRELSQQFLGFHHVSKGKTHMSTPWNWSNGTLSCDGIIAVCSSLCSSRDPP